MTHNWIKTSDSLPELNSWCFFWYGGRQPLIGCYKGDGKFMCSEDSELWIIDKDNISHWMHVPSPPNQ